MNWRRRYSGGPTAAQGGDLGLFKRGALAKVLEDQTFGLKAGESTAPIRTRQGFVILKVTDTSGGGVPPLKDVEPQIQEAMYMEQMQPALRAYLTKLREDAYIDIKPGFVDTGASPKQTKPVFTAYTPPVAKKKTGCGETAVRSWRKVLDRIERWDTNAASAAAPPASTAPWVRRLVRSEFGCASGRWRGAGCDYSDYATPAVSAKTVSSGRYRPANRRRSSGRRCGIGQAPRNSLPAGPADTLTDKGLGLSAAEGPGADCRLRELRWLRWRDARRLRRAPILIR